MCRLIWAFSVRLSYPLCPTTRFHIAKPNYNISRGTAFPTRLHVRQAKTQIILGIEGLTWVFAVLLKTLKSFDCSQSTLRKASLGGSVGGAVPLETRRSQIQPSLRSATFFRGDWSWNIFYGQSLPSVDSRRAVVSFWRKNIILVNRLEN